MTLYNIFDRKSKEKFFFLADNEVDAIRYCVDSMRFRRVMLLYPEDFVLQELCNVEELNCKCSDLLSFVKIKEEYSKYFTLVENKKNEV